MFGFYLFLFFWLFVWLHFFLFFLFCFFLGGFYCRAVCPICKQDPTKTSLSPRTTQTAAVETGADAETCVECDDATVSISIESTDDDDEAGGGGGGGGAATAEEMSLTVEALATSSSSSSSTGTLSESLLGAEGGSAEVTTL
jgi:hypothetical protein